MGTNTTTTIMQPTSTTTTSKTKESSTTTTSKKATTSTTTKKKINTTNTTTSSKTTTTTTKVTTTTSCRAKKFSKKYTYVYNTKEECLDKAPGIFEDLYAHDVIKDLSLYGCDEIVDECGNKYYGVHFVIWTGSANKTIYY